MQFSTFTFIVLPHGTLTPGLASSAEYRSREQFIREVVQHIQLAHRMLHLLFGPLDTTHIGAVIADRSAQPLRWLPVLNRTAERLLHGKVFSFCFR